MGGGSTTSTSTPSKESQATTNFIREKIMMPLATMFMPQMTKLMQSGGAGPGQPPIVTAGQKAATGGAKAATNTIDQSLMRAGLAGTPFASRIGAETTAGGAAGAAGVGPAVAQSMYTAAPNMMTGTGSDIIKAQQGYGTSTSTSTPSMGSQLMGGASMLMSLLPFLMIA
jgi:hypothetical protein